MPNNSQTTWICPSCPKKVKVSRPHKDDDDGDDDVTFIQTLYTLTEKYKSLLNLVLSVNAILFGWHQNANNKRVLNYIFIIVKYYIFTTSVCDNKLRFDCFLLSLNSKLDVLRTIAIKNKSLNKFETTWAPLS